MTNKSRSADRSTPIPYTLKVEWWDGGSRSEFLLDEIDEVARVMHEESLQPVGFSSNCEDLVLVLEAISPLIDPDFDEGSVNGVDVVVAEHCNGGHWLVPALHQAEVELLGSGSAHWLSIGPCSFDQAEDLARLGDLYWVDTRGDVEQQRIVVGRFSDPATGLAAAVDKSVFFRFDASGSLVCELDSWPKDE